MRPPFLPHHITQIPPLGFTLQIGAVSKKQTRALLFPTWAPRQTRRMRVPPYQIIQILPVWSRLDTGEVITFEGHPRMTKRTTSRTQPIKRDKTPSVYKEQV